MTRNDIKKLQSYKSYPSVTIIIPTEKTIPDKLQNSTRLKDAVGKAIDLLLKEFSKQEILYITNAIDELVSKIDFSKTLDGLALFVNKDIAQIYYLPFRVKENITVNKQFETRNLLSAINRSKEYWALAISKNHTRLFKGSLGYLKEIIDTEEKQKNMEGFPYKLNYDVTSDRKLQAYSTGDKDAAYITAFDKDFLNNLDKLLSKYIDNNQDNLLVILGVSKNRSYFKQVSTHKNIIIGEIEGDFSKSSLEEIKNKTEKTIKEFTDLEEKKALEMLKEAQGKLKFSFGLKETWDMALDGRIRTLLVEENYQVPGSINKDNKKFIMQYNHPVEKAETDIIDDLIDQVIEHRGKIIFVHDNALKDYEHVAAILRY